MARPSPTPRRTLLAPGACTLRVPARSLLQGIPRAGQHLVNQRSRFRRGLLFPHDVIDRVRELCALAPQLKDLSELFLPFLQRLKTGLGRLKDPFGHFLYELVPQVILQAGYGA